MCSLVALTSEGLQQDRTRIFSRETALILRCRLRTKQPKAVNDKRGEDRMWGAAHGQMVNEPSVVSPRPISAPIVSQIGRGRTTSSWLRLRSSPTASTKRSMYLGCVAGKPSVCFQLHAAKSRKTDNSFVSETKKREEKKKERFQYQFYALFFMQYSFLVYCTFSFSFLFFSQDERKTLCMGNETLEWINND